MSFSARNRRYRSVLQTTVEDTVLPATFSLLTDWAQAPSISNINMDITILIFRDNIKLRNRLTAVEVALKVAFGWMTFSGCKKLFKFLILLHELDTRLRYKCRHRRAFCTIVIFYDIFTFAKLKKIELICTHHSPGTSRLCDAISEWLQWVF